MARTPRQYPPPDCRILARMRESVTRLALPTTHRPATPKPLRHVRLRVQHSSRMEGRPWGGSTQVLPCITNCTATHCVCNCLVPFSFSQLVCIAIFLDIYLHLVLIWPVHAVVTILAILCFALFLTSVVQVLPKMKTGTRAFSIRRKTFMEVKLASGSR